MNIVRQLFIAISRHDCTRDDLGSPNKCRPYDVRVFLVV